MKSNKNLKIIQKALVQLYDLYPTLPRIIEAIDQAGGTPYYVGGMVRDILLGLSVKDVDIEVHGLSPEKLQSVLSTFGTVDKVGKSFGVFKLYGLNIDWSLPRADSAGRKPDVAIDPHMPIEQACARRDLTINAMGINAITGELVDPFNGEQDVKEGILRSPDISFFSQDSLRFYRVMQFIARFDMQPDDELEEQCRTMDISSVSRERIEQEFNKMLLRSKQPSLGIRWLKDIGRLQDVLPELYQTIGFPQKQPYHPEGDVFEHLMQALDAAADISEDMPTKERLILMYAALCHDLGKPHASKIVDEKVVTSRGHAPKGAPIAQKMLKRISGHKHLIKTVAKLVRYHMEPLGFMKSNAKIPAYKRLAHKLSPDAHLELLGKLFLADKRGRNEKKHKPLPGSVKDFSEVQTFFDKARKANVTKKKEPPVLTGKDFLDVAQPGPLVGKMVKKAYELQMEGETDPQRLKEKVVAQLK